MQNINESWNFTSWNFRRTSGTISGDKNHEIFTTPAIAKFPGAVILRCDVFGDFFREMCFFARTQKRESLQRLYSHDGLLSGDRRFSASGLPDGRESRRFTRASLLQRHARRYVSEIRRDLVFFLNYSCCIKKRAARIWWQINGDVNRHSRPVAPTPRSTCPHFYKWLGTGCIVSGRTTNTKLTKLYWPSRKRSPKRLIVLLEPKSGWARPKIFSALCAGSVPPPFKFVLAPLCTGADFLNFLGASVARIENKFCFKSRDF